VTLRSFLFVPGDSEKKLAKGGGSGADALILDLEDSVAPGRKALAREMVAAHLAAGRSDGGPQLWVRINPLDEGGIDDLAAVVRGGPRGIMVPKTDGPEDIVRLGHYLDALEARDGIGTPIRILPVATETARAPFGLGRFGTRRCRALRPDLGAEDLSTAIGASSQPRRDRRLSRSPSAWCARSACLAARAAGVEPVDTLFVNFRDPEGLRADCVRAAQEGFTGRYRDPSGPGRDHQRDVLALRSDRRALRVACWPRLRPIRTSAPSGSTGKMLDIPHLKQARQVIARHAAHAGRS
jgi:citrate lyase subunit beta/citryl-CoA lyase